MAKSQISKLIAEWTPQSDNLNDFQRWCRRYDLYTGSFLSATQQRNFSVMVRSDGKNIPKIKRGLRLLLPLLKDFPNSLDIKDCVYIDIFDYTLSEDGSYWMLVSRNERNATIVKSFYGRESIQFQGTLHQALKYIAKNHWYDWGE